MPSFSCQLGGSNVLFSEHSKADCLAKSAFDELHSLSNDILQGRLPWYFYQIWNGSSLTALNDKNAADLETNETMDCRPICKGEAIKKVITKALYKPYMNKIKAGCEPSQFSVGTNGGGSQLIMAITLLLEANPGWVVIALDISNAFNEIQRHSILEELWKNIELRPLWYYNFCNMMISGFIGLAYGPFMKAATYHIRWTKMSNKVIWKPCPTSV